MLFVLICRAKLFFFCVVCCLLTHTVGYSQTPDTQESALFLKAEHAIRMDDPILTNRLVSQLKNTPLYSYLIFQKIKKEIAHNQNYISVFYDSLVDLDDILNYQKAYPDSPLAPKLRYIWLEAQAAQKRWGHFLEAIDPKDDLSHSVSLSCHHLYAQYQANPSAKTIKPALKLWMVNHEQPAACTPVFKLLYEHGLIDQHKLIEKHQLLIEKKTHDSLSLAKKLRTQMDAKHHAIASLWESWIKNPAQITQTSFDELKKYRNAVLVSAFKRYARINPAQASIAFEENESKFKLTPFERGEIIKQIAIFLASNHHKKASAWLANIPSENLDDKTREWQIRMAIRNQSWKEVLQFINKLPAPLAKQPAWQYWKARSLEALDLPGYKKIYESLASHRDYYGFLAAEYLNQNIQLNHRPHKSSPEAMQALENRPAIQRIKALLTLNRPVDANREWYHMVASMNTIEKSLAAQLAYKLKWYPLAIYTFNQSDYKDDVLTRFPLAFEESIVSHAEDYQMDSAWLFAIARQESNFNFLALSPVGAMGLMQLMPKTAASVAENRSPNLFHAHTNLELGTRYLKSLRDQIKNPILVTAAYNAGPGKMKRWLPEEPMAGDIWIDSIPYEETRNYVKNVLTYTCIYKTLQNKRFMLSKMMPTVHPNS